MTLLLWKRLLIFFRFMLYREVLKFWSNQTFGWKFTCHTHPEFTEKKKNEKRLIFLAVTLVQPLTNSTIGWANSYLNKYTQISMPPAPIHNRCILSILPTTLNIRFARHKLPVNEKRDPAFHRLATWFSLHQLAMFLPVTDSENF